MTKKKTAETTVTEASAQAVLRRRGASQLAAVEEKVLRMRLGASLPRKSEIEWMGTESEELAIELRALEIETYLKLRAHQARRVVRRRRPGHLPDQGQDRPGAPPQGPDPLGLTPPRWSHEGLRRASERGPLRFRARAARRRAGRPAPRPVRGFRQ